jgi:hypothetical protein
MNTTVFLFTTDVYIQYGIQRMHSEIHYLWNTLELLHVSAASCNHQGVIITNVYKLTCQYTFRCFLFNPLNAELNPICYLLLLLGDLKFMGPCIVSIFQYISNKMQHYTVYLYLETALHVSGGTSTHHQERIQLSVLWVAYATHSTLKPVPTLPR